MRKLATIRRISAIDPIPDADAIEVATVDGWKVVVKKGEYRSGDLAVYCEIDSFLPIREEFEFLRKSSYRKLPDSEGFRLKTVKLRGQLSQGLLLPISIIPFDAAVGDDVSEFLGIIKYEPPIPVEMAGEVEGPWNSLIPKTDQERIQNIPEVLIHGGETWWASEKLEGTSVTCYRDDSLHICSRNWPLKQGTNIYWQVCGNINIPEGFAVQGEIVGPGVQGNIYKLTTHKMYVFDIYDIRGGRYLNWDEIDEFCSNYNLETVPHWKAILPSTVDSVLEHADGDSILCQLLFKTPREGIVWNNPDRSISFKAISNNYLCRQKN